MKIRFIFLSLIWSGLLLAADEPTWTPVADWSHAHPQTENGITTVADSIAGNDLVLVKGVTVEEDPLITTGKVLVFDGTQTEPAHALRKAALNVKFCLSISAKISPEGADQDQTLFYYFGGMEVRYDSKAKAVKVIVYPKDAGAETQAKPIEISQTVQLDKWTKIKASVNGAVIQFSVDDATQAGTIPDGQTLRVATSALTFGFGGSNGRAFKGSLADVSVLQATP